VGLNYLAGAKEAALPQDLFRFHCQLFPDSYKLDIAGIDELRGVLTFWIGGRPSTLLVHTKFVPD